MAAAWRRAAFCALLLNGCARTGADANPNNALTAQTHAKFPLATGTHVGVDCNSCHGEFNTFAQFDCLNGCHTQSETDPAHANVSGYAYTSNACYSCHPDGVGGAPADHPLFFPIDSASKHATIGCTQCHTDLQNPKVATNFACGSCHAGLDASLDAHHLTTTSNPRILVNKSEYRQADSSTCLRCHGDSQVDLTSAHPRNGEGSPPHERAICTQCHDTYRKDKTFAADFTASPQSNPGHGCANCHANGIPN